MSLTTDGWLPAAECGGVWAARGVEFVAAARRRDRVSVAPGAEVGVWRGGGRRRLIGVLRMDRVATTIRGRTLLMVPVMVARGRVVRKVSAVCRVLVRLVTSLGLAGVKG